MSTRNRFLEGPFAPVTEELTAYDLPVTGQIPAELNGRYFRNGPNPMGIDDPNYHWFIGAGMLHGVRLRDGHAEWYRNRWVRSKSVAESLGEAWPEGPVHAGMDFAANTHVISHGGRILATVKPARCLTSSPPNSRRSARATSKARCQAASRPIQSSTIERAICTPSPTSGAGTMCNTLWSIATAK